jgi:hypothetical protein
MAGWTRQSFIETLYLFAVFDDLEKVMMLSEAFLKATSHFYYRF